MKRQNSNFVEYVILGVLGALVALTLVVPQLLRNERPFQLLSVSVLLRDTDSSGWAVARQGMEQAADELGAELRFLTLAAQNDSREQEELLYRELEGGADALVVVPADPGRLYAALLQRQEELCPVVTMESPMDGSAGLAAPDNRQLGRQLALALLEDWSGGEVLLLDWAGSCTGVTDRLEAARETLEEAGVPVRRTAALSGRTGDWVMAFEPAATLQAAQWKEEEGLRFALYGVGVSTEITVRLERGTIQALAAWSDYAAGYLAVRRAVEQSQGERRSLEPLPFSIVRGEDIYAPENQKLLFPVTS